MNRFLLNFDTTQLDKEYYDVIIVGAGIGGLYTALQLPETMSVLILSKEKYEKTNSYKAQGGIACVMDDEKDNVDKHIEDTLKCGHYKNNVKAVEVMIKEARIHINQLIEYGVKFDRNSCGEYNMGMEGAHSEKRILHSGDTTGLHIMDVLYKEMITRKNITHYYENYVVDILSDEQKCYGVLVKQDEALKAFYAKHTVLATGGIGKVLNMTTNDPVSTGDGIGMAIRAGVALQDMNYLQYHPTVFAKPGDHNDHFLISEAVRGEGARILDENEIPLMTGIHPFGDLAPRDIVAKVIFDRIKKQYDVNQNGGKKNLTKSKSKKSKSKKSKSKKIKKTRKK
jgi:L-aspartate oxidase